MKTFKADLHIHTCLSACAELDMTPPKIIKEAKRRGIEIIAITDHNSAENIPAFNALKDEGIKVFAGMEITSSEEVHVLAIFENYEDIKPLQEIVYRALEGPEFDDRLGYQLVVNEKEEILSFIKRPLIGATKLSIFEIVNLIHTYDGLAIASHIDKEVFSIVSQLGFIPKDIIFDGLEVSVHTDLNEAKKRFGHLGTTFIRSSDSHHLNEIGRAYTDFFINAPSLEEIKKALRGEGGRRVL